MIDVFGHTSQGLARANNEDSLVIDGRTWSEQKRKSLKATASTPVLAAVADGLGGHPSGEIASSTALRSLQESFDRNHFSPQDAITAAHNAVCALAVGKHAGMGTTLTGFVIDDSTASFFNVGDSRAYLLDASGLSQVSVDDSDPLGAITQCLGVASHPTPKAHVANARLQPGDLLVAVSDGVSEGVSEQKMAEILSSGNGNLAELLCDAAKKAGSGDDTTAVVIVYESARP